MNKHLQYLGYVVRHKWYTFKAARELGITWLGIIHDWTKFLPSEWFAYVENFYGGCVAYQHMERPFKRGDFLKGYGKLGHPEDQVVVSYDSKTELVTCLPWATKEALDRAWLHHQKSNKHHWQYWLLQYDLGDDWTIQPRDIHKSEMADLYFQGQSTGMAYTDWRPEVVQGKELEEFDARIAYLLNLPPVALPMPDKYRREMLADLIAVEKCGGLTALEYYKKNRHNIILHPETREWVEEILGIT